MRFLNVNDLIVRDSKSFDIENIVGDYNKTKLPIVLTSLLNLNKKNCIGNKLFQARINRAQPFLCRFIFAGTRPANAALQHLHRIWLINNVR